jgi:ABC-type multidrug transport system fused ATPase/permease subunit
MSNLVVDGVQGSAEISAFRREADYLDKFEEIVEKESLAGREQNRILAAHVAASVLGVQILAVLLLVLAIPLVGKGELDGRLLAVLVLGSIASYESILPLPQAFQQLEEHRQAARRLFEIADEKPLVGDIGQQILKGESLLLTFDHLSFAYSHNQSDVLSNVTIVISPGHKIAILGPSGAGKSTLANLLLRFWDYSKGEINLNGEDIRLYPAAEVRQAIGYLPQNPFLFNTSIRENILVGRPGATMSEVEKAAQLAGLDKFILSLPEGYDSLIGEFGAFLSGGQRQRLALARVYLRDAPIYLLDEPTANLDVETEKSILDTLFASMHGKSLILITHRLAGLERMDEIILLDGGRIVERGTHIQLLKNQGEYARIHQLQFDMLLPAGPVLS